METQFADLTISSTFVTYAILAILVSVVVYCGWRLVKQINSSQTIGRPGGYFNRGTVGSQFSRGSNDRSGETASDKTFADVAGCEEAIKKLKRVKRWLVNPGMYNMFGARLPKGVLMVGPPGTGKTLLAKALAGEAGASFINCAGSDFVEVWVGLGASRIREKFAQARQLVETTKKPCIIFIDEIDAVGKKRSSGGPGANDERDQTLNAILVEMDGFAPNAGILVIAATNRADILDPALRRPGRFDYHVTVDLPDVTGRASIFGVHMRNKPLAKALDMKLLAKRSPGLSGAEIEGVCNEAATLAGERVDLLISEMRQPNTSTEQVRDLMLRHLEIETAVADSIAERVKQACSTTDEAASQEATKALIKDFIGIRLAEFDEAIDIIRMGEARVSLTLSSEQRWQTAIHEWGHLAVRKHKGGRVTKVTIMPRMNTLGYVESAPDENQLNLTKEDMWLHILVCMGGRAAQKLILSTEDTGAGNDFEQANRYAKLMVMKFGFSELGPISVDDAELVQNGGYLSEELKREINRHVNKLLKDAQKEAEDIIQQNMERIKRGAKHMIEESETLLEPQIEKLWHEPIQDQAGPKVDDNQG